MRAAGGDADQHVAGADLAGIDQFRFFHRTHGEAGQVVFARRVHVGHLGGFTADQRAAGDFTAFGDAGHDIHGGLDVELAGGEIVEEEQRFRALHQHVVHAHRDQVLADAVVAVELLGQDQLGAHAVGAGDQHRLAIAAREVEQAAEQAHAAQHFRAHRALHQRFDALDDLVARIDVDAGIAIGEAIGSRSLGGGHGGLTGAGNGDFSSRIHAGGGAVMDVPAALRHHFRRKTRIPGKDWRCERCRKQADGGGGRA